MHFFLEVKMIKNCRLSAFYFYLSLSDKNYVIIFRFFASLRYAQNDNDFNYKQGGLGVKKK
jgi:hypothetical protein